MTRQKKYQSLYVYMNGIRVGILSRESAGSLSFAYDQDWLSLENNRPISLSMPLTDLRYRGQKVDCYFDNLLPDSDLIRQRIQARFRAPSDHYFDLLSYIGADCIGALQLLQEEKLPFSKSIKASPINDKDIAKLLKHYQTAPLGMDRENDFRISIAGAQEKTALLWHDGQWLLPQGPTPTSHIIKLPIGYIKHTNIDLSESVENEWLCLKILAAFGLTVNEARIVNFEDMKTLVVKRFDRRWADLDKWLIRLPQEDMCQALSVSPGLKYESDGGPGIESIMKVLLSSAASSDRQNFIKTVFLFWVMGAIDGHAKNFSLSIEAQGRYKMTPLYDVISAYPMAAKNQISWQTLKMAMSLKGKKRHYLWNVIQLRHWQAAAARSQFSESMMQAIIEEVFDTMESVITSVKATMPHNFPQHISGAIFSGMRGVKNR